MERTQYIQFCLAHLADTKVYPRTMAPAVAITKLLKTNLRKFFFNLMKHYGHLNDRDDTKITEIVLCCYSSDLL